MSFRNYLVGTVFISLFIWGPIDNSLPHWVAIRIAYLLIIPLLLSLILKWVWFKYQPSYKLEFKLIRLLSFFISLVLLLTAFTIATSKAHSLNNEYVNTKDGLEEVGEDIILKGPDWSMAIVLTIIAGLILWFGVFKKSKKSPNN